MKQSKLARAFYRRLLRLYPRQFRAQFGESMAQTFDDLWQEKTRTHKEWFGFVKVTVTLEVTVTFNANLAK